MTVSDVKNQAERIAKYRALESQHFEISAALKVVTQDWGPCGQTITIISMVDGKPCLFPVVKAASKTFKCGKCWTAYCQNPIWFVHLTAHGNADVGKCYCCVQLRAFEYFVKKLRQHGRWVMPEKGKPVEWRFNEKTLSFAPVKRTQKK